MRKVSLAATVLNEGPALRRWLEALSQQTRQPDEIVICDGGSTDGTLDELRAFAQAHPSPPLRIISKPGSNIAAGRNAAISAATGEIIAVSDSGSLPQGDWLAELIRPFDDDPRTQLVAGHYRFLEDTPFRKAASAYLGRPWESPRFMPSARSAAFTKELWQSVGGYPEWLTQAGEDTLFYLLVLEKKAEVRAAPRAIVTWNTRPNLRSFLRMIARNAAGEAETGRFAHAAFATFGKLAVEAALLIGIFVAVSVYHAVWAGVVAAVGVVLFALIVRAVVRRAPLVSWPQFFALCLLGGVTYLFGRTRAASRNH